MPAIDFSILDNIGRATIAQEERKEIFNIPVSVKEQNQPTGITGPFKDKVYYSLDMEQKQREKTFQMYADYQKNIRIGGQLTIEITKGIQAGTSPMNLLLKAIETIGLMMGDPQLLIESKKNLQAIYIALGDEETIADELQEVEGRLLKLELAYKDTLDKDSAARISRAIKMHQERAATLR